MIPVFPVLRCSSRASCVCLLAIVLLFQSQANAVEKTLAPVASTSFVSLLQVLFGLGLVLAAIAGTAWLLRRFAPGQIATQGNLRVVSGVMVGPKERVVLVDVGDTRLVLGVTPGQVNLLHQMSRPEIETAGADETGNAATFYERLKQAMRQRKAL